MTCEEKTNEKKKMSAGRRKMEGEGETEEGRKDEPSRAYPSVLEDRDGLEWLGFRERRWCFSARGKGGKVRFECK